MSLLTKIRENPIALPGATIVLLAVSGLVIYSQVAGGGSRPYLDPKWMFDLNTQKLVKADALTNAPHDGGEGMFDYGELGVAGSQVDAIVYTCGNPNKIKAGMTAQDLESVDAWIGHVHRPDSQAGAGAGGMGVVSTIQGYEWHAPFTSKGAAITDEFYELCPNGKLPQKSRP
ncbi:MAG: hypothetical protein AAGK09_07035 [Planctomycetota bacterium]